MLNMFILLALTRLMLNTELPYYLIDTIYLIISFLKHMFLKEARLFPRYQKLLSF